MSDEGQPVRTRRAKPLLGTLVDIWVETADAASGRRAIDAAFGEIAAVHRLMSFHEPGSDLSRLNRAAVGGDVAVDPRTAEVLAFAASCVVASEGAFDVGVGSVLVERGSLPSPSQLSPGDAPPSAENTCTVRRGARLIDLGGIAKGYAVDRAIDALARHGVHAALVNAGGDLRHIGATPVDIEVRDPADASRIEIRLTLANSALASSATSGLAGPHDTATAGASALIDPRTGAALPARAGASVVAAQCMIADMLTKVVLVTGNPAHPMLALHGATLVVHRHGDRPA